jgi:hypothetical protein
MKCTIYAGLQLSTDKLRIKDGFVFHAPTMLKDVKEIVEKARKQ